MTRRLLALAVCLLSAFTVRAEDPSATTGDLNLKNGKIWIGDLAHPEVDGLVVRNGRMNDAGGTTPAQVRNIDLAGKRIVPGFYDSHVHLLGGGMRLSQVALKDAKDEAEFGQRLRDFDKKLPRERWMLGGEWDHDRALKGELPTAELLDKYAPDRPVFLRRYDGHMAVANTKAMKLAGIAAKAADIPGGVVYRDKDGKPTGLLRDNAMFLVERLVPPPTDDEIAEAVIAALDELRRNGVTSVVDMDGSDAATRRKLFKLYQRMAREGKLTVRIDLRWPLAAWKEQADLGAEANFGSEWVTIGGVKGFADGSLGSSTAKMFERSEERRVGKG